MTMFRPYGTKLTLPIMGRSKCKLQAQDRANIRTMVCLVQGKEQILLGRHDGMRLGIISVNPAGGKVPQQTARLEEDSVKPRTEEYTEVDQRVKKRMQEITDKYPSLFEGKGIAKVFHVAFFLYIMQFPQSKHQAIGISPYNSSKQHVALIS